MWRRIQADGCEWEVRASANEVDVEARTREEDVLEFRCLDGLRPPRRVAVGRGALERMDEPELRTAYRRALPIGADHYGRPGKHMTDTGV